MGRDEYILRAAHRRRSLGLPRCIDLPAPVGTPVHAMADGVVHRAGPADQVFSSTHVRLKVVDPIDGKNDLFLVYLHLDSVAEKMISGATVKQGDVIGAVGQEDATYPHLHFEFRKGKEPTRWSQPLAYGGWWAENSSPAS